MNKPLLKNKLGVVAICVLLLSAFNVSAQCVVGGTNFDTDASLCNPSLTQEDWLNPKVDSLVKKACSGGNYTQPNINQAKHVGLASNFIESKSDPLTGEVLDYTRANSILNPTWNMPNLNPAFLGYNAIVSNPKVLHSYYMDRPGNNILVNVGAKERAPFFSYTVTGLKPGSTVTMTATVYNLIDMSAYQYQITDNNVTLEQIKDAPYKYGKYFYEVNGGVPQMNGNALLVGGAVGAVPTNGQFNSVVDEKLISWSDTDGVTIEIEAIADAGGSATFHIIRGNRDAAQIPVGVDNVKITGVIEPEIVTSKRMPVCEENPVLFTTKQIYPSGTDFDWKVTNSSGTTEGTGDGSSFSFVPKNETYKVSLTVTMGSCSAPAKENFEITTKTCCTETGPNGTPVATASTYIIYDDFGRFPSVTTPPSATTYEWTKPGASGPSIGTATQFWTATDMASKAVADEMGIDCPNLAYFPHPNPVGGNSDNHNVYAIVNRGPYKGEFDADNNTNGGMLFIGLNKPPTGLTSFENAVLYQRTVDGLCENKKITFGAQFAAGNVNGSNPVISVKLQLVQGTNGAVIKESASIDLIGNQPWETFEAADFTLDPGITSATLRVICTSQGNYVEGNDKGDLLIDNIFFSVCTPPDIDIKSELEGDALLDLCSETPFKLDALVAQSTIDAYYGDKVGYLFQYTFDDPDLPAANPIWYPLGGGIKDEPTIVINDPSVDPAFNYETGPGKDKKNTYFRVVIGFKDDLKNDQLQLDYLSPCRNISISQLSIKAGLNCQTCSKAENLTISSSVIPVPAEATATDKTPIVYLCEGDSVKLNATSVSTSDTTYTAAWLKEDKTTIINDTLKSTSTKKDFKVTYADVQAAGAKGVKYFVRISDDFVEDFECAVWDSITIIANPTPTEKLTDTAFCAGSLTATTMPNLSIKDNKITWTIANGTTAGAKTPDLAGLNALTADTTYYYTVTNDTTGCVSKPNEYNVTVNAIPKVKITSLPDTTVLTCTNPSIALTASSTVTGTPTFTWSGASTATTANITASTAGKYLVTAALAGCEDTVSVTLTEDKVKPTAVITPDPNTKELTCTTTSIALTPSGGDTQNWLQGSATATVPGTYQLEVTTTANGCKDTAKVVITEDKKKPVVTVTTPAGFTKLTCEATNVILTADITTSTGTAPFTYTWTATAGGSIVGATDTDKITVEEGGTYEVIATGANGCKDTATITIIKENDPPALTITTPATTELTCTVTGIELEATSTTIGTTFEWTKPDITKSPGAALTATTPGEYKVRATGLNKCFKDTFIVITQDIEKPTLTVTPAAPEICTGDNVTLTVAPADVAKINPAGYIWTPATALDVTTGNSVVANPTAATTQTSHTYTVEGTNLNGCKNTTTVTVKVNPLPTVTLTDPAAFCEGSGTNPAFTISTCPTCTINWEATAPDVAGQPAGTHPFEYTVTDGNGCTGDKLTYTVNVIALPPTLTYDNVAYFLDDLSGDNFPVLTVKDANINTKLVSGAKFMWSTDGGTTFSDSPIPAPVKPTDAQVASGIDIPYTNFYVKQVLTGTPACESQPSNVPATVYLTPVPVVKSISYCQGDAPSTTDLMVEKNTTGGYDESQLELRWYGAGTSQPEKSNSYTTTPDISLISGEKTTFWVSQYNKTSDSESSIVPFDVFMYAKPTFKNLPAPAPKCASMGESVAINTSSVWEVENHPVAMLPATYFDKDNNNVTASAGAISMTGTNNYTVQVALNTVSMSNFKGNADNCVSKNTIVVDVRELEIFVDNAKTCPNSEANLAVDVTKQSDNLGTLSYEWTIDGVKTTTAAANTKTQPLAGSANDTYTFSVEVTDGVCTQEALNKTITLGDGPIEGTMTVTDNSDKAIDKLLTKEPDGSYYTCGEEVLIETGYTSKDENGNDINDFVWYLNNVKVADGKNLTITNMTDFGTRTYTLKYTNKCATSVDVTIRAVPMEVTQDNPKMELCENTRFEANLNINIHSGENPSIEWTTPNGMNPEDKKLVIEKANPEHSGEYSYVVTNRNCKVEGKISDGKKLMVSGAVSFEKEAEEALTCATDAVEVSIKAVTTTEGNTPVLAWRDPIGNANTIQGDNSRLSITAKPAFTPGNADENRRSTYTYTLIAVNEYCSDSIDVPVYVDEPLSGKIEPVAPICEGKTTILNAQSYNAQSYVWTADMDTMPLKQTAIQTITPPVGITTYSVHTERGLCKKDDQIEVTVTTIPVIIDIDSVDIKARRIIYDENLGTQPFEFAVDTYGFDSEATKYDLFFGAHKFYIKDANGCESVARDYIVPAPVLIIPKHFSPGNGDEINDTWEIANISVYENALITIYDRFGKQLVQYNSSVSGWDGTYLGKDMPATDYWYQIDVPEIDKQYVGHFTLLRK